MRQERERGEREEREEGEGEEVRARRGVREDEMRAGWMSAVIFLLVALCAIVRSGSTPILVAKSVQEFSHDERAFTEGLLFRDSDGALLESTGLSGQSLLHVFKVDTGKGTMEKVKSVHMPKRHFGEGIALWGRRGDLVSLTWRSQKVHIFDRHSLEHKSTLDLDSRMGEGWGLTVSSDRDQLIASDGSAVLHFLQRGGNRLGIVSHVSVRDCANNMPHVTGLNELELVPACVILGTLQNSSRFPGCGSRIEGAPIGAEDAIRHGNMSVGSTPLIHRDLVLANVITTTCIAAIDPTTGHVAAWILLSDLYEGWDKFNKVPNGIAYRAYDRTLWLTGKDWTKLFRVNLEAHPNPSSVTISKTCRNEWSNYRFKLGSVVGREDSPCKN